MDAQLDTVPLIRTKLHRPPVTADLVRRDRLLELMDGALEAPLTLVSAPAGYGKSVLVAQWAELHAHPCAWLSLDAEDGDLREFLRYFVAAVDSVVPGACDATQELLTAGELPPIAVLAGHLVNELDAIDCPCSIVLDDYHRIHLESPVHELVNRLLEHPPRGLHLVLITRRDPPLRVSSLLAGGRVIEARLQDLRFTAPETREFLTAAVTLDVTEEALANLGRQCDGWAVGLRLVSLALRHHAANPDAFLRGLDGGIPQTQEYLLEEVLAAQSPEVRDCLLRSSILERFCSGVVDAVCASTKGTSSARLDGRGFVELLQRGNVFTIPLDGRGEWFRYHHLFQELLQRRLRERTGDENIADLHIRAAGWFETEGLIDEALKHALAADEVELAAQIVERHRLEALNADQWYRIENWLSHLPAALVQQRAELLIARAWVLLRRLRIEEMLPVLDRVESVVDQHEDTHPSSGEVALFRGFIAYFMGDGVQSARLLGQALRQLPPSHHEPRSEAETMFALANQMEGRQEHAIRRLDEQLRLIHSVEDLRTSRLLAIYVFVYAIAGSLEEAEAANRRFQAAAARGGHSHVQAWGSYLQGLINLNQYALEAAVAPLRRAVEQRFVHHKRAAVDSFAALMLALAALGRDDDAQSVLELLREYRTSLGDQALATIADSAEIRLAILQDRRQTVARWLRRIEPPATEVMLFWVEIPCLTWCRALISDGSAPRLGEAEKRLRQHAAVNKAQHNTCHLIEVLTLLAMACEKQGKDDEALTFLEQAVTLAGPRGFIFPFVEAGPSMAGMLEQLLEESDEADFIRRVLVAFSKLPAAVPAVAPRARAAALSIASVPSVPGRLTNRELEVLELLAQRLQSKEIATRMFISAQTVSFHLKNIYRKLGAHSRRQAVDRATQAGILAKR